LLSADAYASRMKSGTTGSPMKSEIMSVPTLHAAIARSQSATARGGGTVRGK
jgi:hypothetical protein